MGLNFEIVGSEITGPWSQAGLLLGGGRPLSSGPPTTQPIIPLRRVLRRKFGADVCSGPMQFAWIHPIQISSGRRAKP